MDLPTNVLCRRWAGDSSRQIFFPANSFRITYISKNAPVTPFGTHTSETKDLKSRRITYLQKKIGGGTPFEVGAPAIEPAPSAAEACPAEREGLLYKKETTMTTNHINDPLAPGIVFRALPRHARIIFAGPVAFHSYVETASLTRKARPSNWPLLDSAWTLCSKTSREAPFANPKSIPPLDECFERPLKGFDRA